MKKLCILSIFLFSFVTQAGPRPVKIWLRCDNPGSHQDVAKTPIITNITGTNIGNNVKIFWNATDGDHGEIYGPLAAGASKSALGNPGNAYQCTAYYWKTN